MDASPKQSDMKLSGDNWICFCRCSTEQVAGCKRCGTGMNYDMDADANDWSKHLITYIGDQRDIPVDGCGLQVRTFGALTCFCLARSATVSLSTVNIRH